MAAGGAGLNDFSAESAAWRKRAHYENALLQSRDRKGAGSVVECRRRVLMAKMTLERTLQNAAEFEDRTRFLTVAAL